MCAVSDILRVRHHLFSCSLKEKVFIFLTKTFYTKKRFSLKFLLVQQLFDFFFVKVQNISREKWVLLASYIQNIWAYKRLDSYPLLVFCLNQCETLCFYDIALFYIQYFNFVMKCFCYCKWFLIAFNANFMSWMFL